MLLHQCLNLFEKSGLITYSLADNSREDRIIGEITNSNNSINPTIYESYSSNFRKAVDSVFKDGENELSDKLKANVSRFAAYKSMHATRQIRSTITDTGSINDAKKILHKFNRWQAAEYNTTVARSRTAKQWQEFASEENLVLFPNLRWIPSRSATPREEHVVFWNKVWAKTDPFWTQNQPGSLWNCGCDWEETDAPVSGMSYHKSLSAKGLEGNPAITGEIFTDISSYMKLAEEGAETDVLRIVRKDNLEWAKNNLKVVKHPEIAADINFSTRTIKEYLNQPHDDYYLKNEMIRRMNAILTNAEYMGTTEKDGRISEIFKTTINGKINYLIANWHRDKKLWFHSVTNSNKVLKNIKK